MSLFANGPLLTVRKPTMELYLDVQYCMSVIGSTILDYYFSEDPGFHNKCSLSCCVEANRGLILVIFSTNCKCVVIAIPMALFR